jgi:hypothetical protein
MAQQPTKPPTSVVSGTRPTPQKPPLTVAECIYPHLNSSAKPTKGTAK